MQLNIILSCKQSIRAGSMKNTKNKSSVVFSMHTKLCFKIITVGNKHAGKTSLIMRFVKDIFDFNYKVTIGVQFYSKIIQDADEEIAIQIWDTAGSQNYKSVVRSFYNFAHCVLLVYETEGDLDNILPSWMAEIQEHAKKQAYLVLVRTKIDIFPIEQEQKQKVQKIKEKYKINLFMAVSAKKNENVNELFGRIGKELHHLYETNQKFRQLVSPNNESILLTSTQNKQSHKMKKKCCN